jgi:hypothetical protein
LAHAQTKWPARSRAQTVLMALKMSSSETLYPLSSFSPYMGVKGKNEATLQKFDPNHQVRK